MFSTGRGHSFTPAWQTRRAAKLTLENDQRSGAPQNIFRHSGALARKWNAAPRGRRGVLARGRRRGYVAVVGVFLIRIGVLRRRDEQLVLELQAGPPRPALNAAANAGIADPS